MTELPEPRQFGDYGEWPGRAVIDPSGERLGEVREIYLDDATDRPEWVLVAREEREPRFVPLADATVEGDSIRVAQAAERVDSAPALEPTKQLTQDQERDLYSHYGVELSDEASTSVLPAVDDEPAPTTGEEAEAPAPETGEEADVPPAAAPEPREEAEAPPAAAVEEPPAPVLPAPGDTSAPEHRGPMVPPRPEPVAPPPPPPPEPAGGPLAVIRRRPVPVVAGIAAAVGAAIFLYLRRRS